MARGGIPDRVRHQFELILESPSGYQKFKRMMAATKNEKAYLEYFKECMDRKFGKSPQFLDMELNDVTARPDAETLNDALRSLNGHTEGNGVAKGT